MSSARATERTGEATDASSVVPLRRQYLQIKARYPDAILFFRLGDFYETFDSDAEIAAALLDLVLTSREMGKGVRVPMAGMPYHAAEGYIARLIQAGHKVAICEQVGNVSKGRALVERDVTRVVTPGTVVEPGMLDARANNYIAAVIAEGNRAGIAHADISTGEFATTEITGGSPEETLLAAGRELLRLAPAELVLPEAMAGESLVPPEAWLPGDLPHGSIDPWRWRQDRAEEALLHHFDVESLDGFGCAGKPLAARAAGALLQYLADTQRSDPRQITALTTYTTDGFMTLDTQTRRNLELSESARGDKRHSLIAVLDQTRTPMGARLLRRWLGQPLLGLDALRERQDGVARFYDDSVTRSEVRRTLAGVGDIERLVNRTITGIAGPRDMVSLRSALGALPELESVAKDTPGGSPLPSCQEIHALLAEAIDDDPPAVLGKGTVLRPGYAAELDGHRTRAREARDWIAGLERSERERTGMRSLKVGYNKVFGYYLEVTTAALASAERERAAAGNGRSDEPVLPAEYIPKQSLANGTRYFTPQLKEYETVVLTAQDTLAEIEADVFRRVVARVAAAAPMLLAAARIVAYLDVVAALAEVAVSRGYVRPELDDGTALIIDGGRHPVLESVLGRGEYVPNDARLDATGEVGARIAILTGPNMAGKSSWLRQVALIVLLSQIGSFVPADRAKIGVVDRIFTRIGAQDDIATGQSTFMVEMLETANILHHATSRSLVVLDEIGRGTSTYDGLAIARAVVEHLHNAPRLGCRTLFATHYHELTELERILPRVKTFRMEVLEEGERIVFLRQVVPGAADRSYGVHVARIAGIPRPVVRRAQEILDDLEAGHRHDDEPARRRSAMRLPAPASEPDFQLTFFGQPDPTVETLKALDVESLSPLEALTKLFELQRQARGAE
ncbi:MAG TPA: DNA mismatch repair protein MutS [Thermomicrobiales bacterium]|nr:DNA mismatch repair protein MutS [Thermomicrobiales bacterium]